MTNIAQKSVAAAASAAAASIMHQEQPCSVEGARLKSAGGSSSAFDASGALAEPDVTALFQKGAGCSAEVETGTLQYKITMRYNTKTGVIDQDGVKMTVPNPALPSLPSIQTGWVAGYNKSEIIFFSNPWL